jgi:hypothetical protein
MTVIAPILTKQLHSCPESDCTYVLHGHNARTPGLIVYIENSTIKLRQRVNGERYPGIDHAP